MNFSRALKILIAPALAAIYVGCSPVNFAKDGEINRCQNFGQSCIVQNGKDYFEYSVTATGGLVDILIVDDNSASMYFEQARLATRLSNFIQNLENQKADYRIALTTTDISSSENPPRAINQNGALQDGKLIKFPNGEYFLTNTSGTLAQKDEWFKQTISRQETISCETFIKNNYGKSGYSSSYDTYCPSGDEKGVYAANLVVKNNPGSFIRKDAHLAIIFLADEDEAVSYDTNGTPVPHLADLDQPDSLISNVSTVYGASKLLSAHSLVTASQACFTEQNNQMSAYGIRGSYGWNYAKVSQKTQGFIGDICAADYTTQLGQISTNILNKVNSVPLACEKPTDLTVNISGQTGVTYTVSGRELKFSQQLAPGTTASLKYTCETL
jgi:hypothetical protein